jgi:REP element-mobilizing transposase RayT
MTIARQRQICLDSTPYYHCINRCVRRAFLCGEDAVSGRSFDHRKGWIEDRLLTLASVFAVEVCAYAVMSNHYHLVVKLCPERAAAWDDSAVWERWCRLFKGHPIVDRRRRGERLTAAELAWVRSLTETWRQRLTDLSWFMRCLNEDVARRANEEDGCKGRFWEGRFKSQALLDEEALLTCMGYVDLNPVRAGVAQTPEQSTHTSIYERIRALAGDATDERAASLVAFNDQAAAGAPCLPFSLGDYLVLLDWTGRAIRRDKPGAIDASLAGILARLGVEVDQWLGKIQYLGCRAGIALGATARLRQFAERIGQAWIWGCGQAGRTRAIRV